MITREQIQGLFDHTQQRKAEGKLEWDIDGSCRWSYFFFDASRERLTAAAQFLANMGYQSRGLLAPGPDDDGQGPLYLRVDRIEQHSVDSLATRCRELSDVADAMGLMGFDGMDVGAVDGP